MGERIKKMTDRITRIFKRKKLESIRKPISVTRIIRPEQVIRQHGKRAPRTIRRVRPTPEMVLKHITVCVLPNGTTHVKFNGAKPYTVAVRDPVTRRLSRSELRDGLRRTTDYYGRDGKLIDDFKTNW